MPAKTTTRTLPGDWRRRRGTSTDVHLFRGSSFDSRPACGKRIRRVSTERVDGRPCADCLVAEIRAAGTRKESPC